jgi:hypothetical protein
MVRHLCGHSAAIVTGQAIHVNAGADLPGLTSIHRFVAVARWLRGLQCAEVGEQANAAGLVTLVGSSRPGL